MDPLTRKLSTAVLALSVSVSAASAQTVPVQVEELTALRPILDDTGFTGTVLIYDLKRDRWSGIGTDRAEEGRIPASTFKIFNSLVSLETGVLASDTAVMKWDGVTRQRSEWNKDMDLAEAFRVSAVPHYQALARSVGAERMQQWIDKVGYGNRDLTGGLDRFWLAGGLRISPRQQIDLLVRLYKSELPFSKRSMEMVRGIMEMERTPGHVIRAKTGWSEHPDGTQIGWWVGWVEKGDDTFFFASVIESPTEVPSFGPSRTAVPRAVLQRLGVLP